MFVAVLRDTPETITASDGVVVLDLSDWTIRGAYELAVHAYDVTATFGRPFGLSDEVSRMIMDSDALWMCGQDIAMLAIVASP